MICYEIRQLYLRARKWLGLAVARTFGTYVEVDTPTLKYRGYVWCGCIWFIYEPITIKQLADFWAAEFAPKGHCCLCGNRGIIDTRGQIFTPAGYECGAKVFCICPNGRRIRTQDPKAIAVVHVIAPTPNG